MMISSENNEKVTIEDKFLCADCSMCVGSNSILCQFAGVESIRDVVVFGKQVSK